MERKIKVTYSGGPFDGLVVAEDSDQPQSLAQSLGALMVMGFENRIPEIVGRKYMSGIIHEGEWGNRPHFYRVTKAEKSDETIELEAVYEGTSQAPKLPASSS